MWTIYTRLYRTIGWWSSVTPCDQNKKNRVSYRRERSMIESQENAILNGQEMEKPLFTMYLTTYEVYAAYCKKKSSRERRPRIFNLDHPKS